ncbi:MAG: nucleoside 2-deoxyribosyltransferase [Hadesarchaea archaeon]|nr:MAG: nucleoside 2-deoxyribosyltransferase [Hadesarchaea archaeon]
MGTKVFIAGPLFSQAEREFNLKLDRFLRRHGFETILPQRDLGQLWKVKSDKEYGKLYRKDLRGIEKSDLLVAVLDGPDVDSGTAFEIGYASAIGKPVIGLKTDIRVFAREEEINNMLAQSLKIVKNFDELLSLLDALKKSRNRGENTGSKYRPLR